MRAVPSTIPCSRTRPSADREFTSGASRLSHHGLTLVTQNLSSMDPPVVVNVGGYMITIGPSIIEKIGILRRTIKYSSSPIVGTKDQLSSDSISTTVPTSPQQLEANLRTELCVNNEDPHAKKNGNTIVHQSQFSDSDEYPDGENTEDGASKAIKEFLPKKRTDRARNYNVNESGFLSLYHDPVTECLYIESCPHDFRMLLHFLRRGECSMDFIEQHMAYSEFLNLFKVYDIDLNVQRCFYCMAIYDEAVNILEPCLTHPGFPLLNQKRQPYWSCCEQPCILIDPLGRQRTGHGCVSTGHCSTPGRQADCRLAKAMSQSALADEVDKDKRRPKYCELGLTPLPNYCRKCPFGTKYVGGCLFDAHLNEVKSEATDNRTYPCGSTIPLCGEPDPPCMRPDPEPEPDPEPDPEPEPEPEPEPDPPRIPNDPEPEVVATMPSDCQGCPSQNNCHRPPPSSSTKKPSPTHIPTSVSPNLQIPVTRFRRERINSPLQGRRELSREVQASRYLDEPMKDNHSPLVTPAPTPIEDLSSDDMNISQCEKCAVRQTCQLLASDVNQDGNFKGSLVCPLKIMAIHVGDDPHVDQTQNGPAVESIVERWHTNEAELLGIFRKKRNDDQLTPHEESVLQLAYDTHRLSPSKNTFKTKMCPALKAGKCELPTHKCQFAHSHSERRSTDDLFKTQLCTFWSRGNCRAGANCRHAHGEQELRTRPSSQSGGGAGGSSGSIAADRSGDDAIVLNSPLPRMGSFQQGKRPSTYRSKNNDDNSHPHTNHRYSGGATNRSHYDSSRGNNYPSGPRSFRSNGTGDQDSALYSNSGWNNVATPPQSSRRHDRSDRDSINPRQRSIQRNRESRDAYRGTNTTVPLLQEVLSARHSTRHRHSSSMTSWRPMNPNSTNQGPTSTRTHRMANNDHMQQLSPRSKRSPNSAKHFGGRPEQYFSKGGRHSPRHRSNNTSNPSGGGGYNQYYNGHHGDGPNQSSPNHPNHSSNNHSQTTLTGGPRHYHRNQRNNDNRDSFSRLGYDDEGRHNRGSGMPMDLLPPSQIFSNEEESLVAPPADYPDYNDDGNSDTSQLLVQTRDGEQPPLVVTNQPHRRGMPIPDGMMRLEDAILGSMEGFMLGMSTSPPPGRQDNERQLSLPRSSATRRRAPPHDQGLLGGGVGYGGSEQTSYGKDPFRDFYGSDPGVH